MLIHMLSQRLPPESLTGAPLQALQLARAIQDTGDRVRLFTTLPWNIAPDPVFTEGLEVCGLGYPPLLSARPLLRFATAFLAAKEIGASDIVHGHALSTMILGYAMRRNKTSPPFLVKPSLGGEHDEGEVYKLRARLPLGLLQYSMDRIDAFAVLDDAIEADLRSIGVSEERMHRVHNGVDTQRFRPADDRELAQLRAQFDMPPDQPVLLFAGQLCPRKGVEELLSAWGAQIARGTQGILVLCGDGALLPRVLDAQAALPGHVRYLGQLSDAAPAMRMADVFLLPSHWESFGNVVIEAMACGVPVASTSAGIAAEIVADSKTGWRIEDVSASAVENVLARIFGDRAQWSALGQRAFATAQSYDFGHTAAQYRELYTQLLKA